MFTFFFVMLGPLKVIGPFAGAARPLVGHLREIGKAS
jgi:hypothetical protein